MRLYVFEKTRLRKLTFRFIWVIILIFAIVYVSKIAISTFSLPIRNVVIVIDPGHGGMDPGASSKNGVSEKDINLNIALKLRRLIEQGGGTAIMIREDDSGLYSDGKTRIRDKKNEDLKKRHEMINNSGAQLFVSIHLNFFPQSQYYGAQTFYQQGDEKSRQLAELMQNELRETLDTNNDRKSKPINEVYILRNNQIPGALVECGFLSNEKEEKLLQDEHYQEKIAWAIFTGIVKYFAEQGADK